jgi:hypothetical protein
MGGSQAKPDCCEQKCHLVQNIIIDIRRGSAGPTASTVVAVAILTYLDFRENQAEAAGTHLRVLSSFIDMPKLSNQGWLYWTWTDIRYALFTIQEPFLPFHIPLAFREITAVLHPYRREPRGRCPRKQLQCKPNAAPVNLLYHMRHGCAEVYEDTSHPDMPHNPRLQHIGRFLDGVEVR